MKNEMPGSTSRMPNNSNRAVTSELIRNGANMFSIIKRQYPDLGLN